MTRALLAIVPERGPAAVRLLALAVVLVLLPVAVTVDLVVRLLGARQERRVLDTPVVYCEAGHPVEVGPELHWTCRCGMPVTGAAFARCPWCGAREAAVVCPCGRACPNPLWRADE